MGLLANRLDAAGSILVVMAAALVIAFWHTPAVVSGDYPHDVELFEPVTVTTAVPAIIVVPKRNRGGGGGSGGIGGTFHKHVSHYPSYVKGEDPVEEYNRRRLHVDTSDYVKGAQIDLTEPEKRKLLEESLVAFRKKYAKRKDDNNNKKKDKLKTFKKSKKRRKVKNAIKRSWTDDAEPMFKGNDSAALAAMDYPKRFEESDPEVFSYEQTPNENRRQASLPMETKYFQYFNFFGDGSYNTGFKRGSDLHYIDQHERASKGAGIFQKRVKWADKNGGFGEHYWDFNHV